MKMSLTVLLPSIHPPFLTESMIFSIHWDKMLGYYNIGHPDLQMTSSFDTLKMQFVTD